MRTGILAKKIGMTRVFSQTGEHVPVTILHVDSCQVVGVRTYDKNGYTALQIGAGTAKIKNVNRPQKIAYSKDRIDPKQKVVEFRIDPAAMLDLGDVLLADHFVPGQFVDVTGTTIGKGFAGAMKRHNFGGLRASHGVSVSHRSHGSTGNRQDPGKVFKNKKMAGHMGDVRVTQQNLTIVATDLENGLVIVKGCIPGAEGSWVTIRDAVKKPRSEQAPFPGSVKKVSLSDLVTEEVTGVVSETVVENKDSSHED
jgi:large subunit ribosomal protein L3